MKNKLLKVSLKFGLILGGFNLIIGLINSFTFNPDNISQSSSVITNILYWVLDIYWQQIVYYIFGSIVLLTPYIVVLSRTIWLYLFVSSDSKKKQ